MNSSQPGTSLREVCVHVIVKSAFCHLRRYLDIHWFVPLTFVDSGLDLVFSTHSYQRMSFLVHPLQTSFFFVIFKMRYILWEGLESHDSAHASAPIRFNPDWIHIARWIDSNRFETDFALTGLDVEGTNRVQCGLKPNSNRITLLV